MTSELVGGRLLLFLPPPVCATTGGWGGTPARLLALRVATCARGGMRGSMLRLC